MSRIKAGIAQVFIHHTSASLTINENADPTVRGDFESHFNVMVPENAPYYRHTLEGPDDMPAHIKASLLGSSVSIPVTMAISTWEPGREFTYVSIAIVLLAEKLQLPLSVSKKSHFANNLATRMFHYSVSKP